VSPLNEQNRQLIAALKEEFAVTGLNLPIYWGNRNWNPMLPDTLHQMAQDGIKNALAFITSAFSSYSGCRQYREDIARAQAVVGAIAPQVSTLRRFYNHPGFIEPVIENIRTALEQIPPERRDATQFLFTAHSIPLSMAKNCDYEAQLIESCGLVADSLGVQNWRLVYQSRSGSAGQPWLEPDICDALEELHANGTQDVVVMPIGFISDHMEVMFDLDTEARERAAKIGINMIRAATVGTHPKFIRMIHELIIERMVENPERRFLGTQGPRRDFCLDDCCLPGAGRPSK
jgi:ferrochelatase